MTEKFLVEIDVLRKQKTELQTQLGVAREDELALREQIERATTAMKAANLVLTELQSELEASRQEIESLKAQNAAMRKVLDRVQWDFSVLITRGDLADEPRAHRTLEIVQAALAPVRRQLRKRHRKKPPLK